MTTTMMILMILMIMMITHNYPVSIEMVVILVMKGEGASEDVEVAGDNYDGDLDDLGDVHCQAHYEEGRGNITRLFSWRR